ncbi:MAG: Diacylglycerol kinase [Candidatus Marinimicrobia bacterium]|nr:Diacylglycerol kinase [Candidatus Neomarinimicrobiota bacterium]
MSEQRTSRESSLRYTIVANPAAGNGKTLNALDELQYYLNESHLKYELVFTHSPMEAAEIASNKSQQGSDVIVAFGGDGTINEVANGLVGGEAPLGIIPCGSGNDFSKSTGIPKDISAAVDILGNHAVKSIDVGKIEDRYFVNGMGIGFDALVNYRATQMQMLKGKTSYVASIVSSLFQYQSIEMEVEFNGTVKTGKTYLVALGNGFSVGGGFRLTPDAVLDDACFDVCHVAEVKKRTIIRHFSKLLDGRVGAVEQVTLSKSPDLTITSDEHLPIHIDGEVFRMDATEVNVKIVPSALPVIGNWGDTSSTA